MADHLGLEDPSKIRLTPHNCYSQQPKPQPIKYRGVERLADMLVHYNQVFPVLILALMTILCLYLRLKVKQGENVFLMQTDPYSSLLDFGYSVL